MRQVPQAPSPPQTWLTRTSISPAQERSVLPAGNSALFPSSTKITRGILSGGLYGTMSHVGTPHERRRFDVTESHLQRAPSELRELLRRVVAAHRMIVLARREVLTHGDDVDAVLAQLARHGEHFVFVFAEAEHQRRLRDHARVVRP